MDSGRKRLRVIIIEAFFIDFFIIWFKILLLSLNFFILLSALMKLIKMQKEKTILFEQGNKETYIFLIG